MNLNKKVLELESNYDFMCAANATAWMISRADGVVPTPKDLELDPNINIPRLNAIVGPRLESCLWDLLVMEAKRQLAGKSITVMAEAKNKAETTKKTEITEKAKTKEKAEVVAEAEKTEKVATKAKKKTSAAKKEEAPIPLLREKEALKKIEEIKRIKSQMQRGGGKRRRRSDVGIICRPASNH